MFQDALSKVEKGGRGIIDTTNIDPNTLLPTISSGVNTLTLSGKNYTTPSHDPLVLDLNGDGITTTGIDPNNVILFDHTGDGTKTASGWVGAGEGILVRDLDGNGSIDSGRELFGDSTVLTHGAKAGQTAATGFEALADLDLDANGVSDGKFDASDLAYASVKIWQDTNQDGISQASELHTLAEVGVASIDVTGTTSNTSLTGGNTQNAVGTFTRSDGTEAVVGNLLLTHNDFYREFTDDPVVTTAAAALPQMGGSGWVRDLREAMSLGTTAATDLQDKVNAFAAATTRDAQMALLDGVVTAWANTATRVDGVEDTRQAEFDHSFSLSTGERLASSTSFAQAFGDALDAKGLDWRSVPLNNQVQILGQMLLDAGLIKGYDQITGARMEFRTWSQSAADAFADSQPALGRQQLRALEAFNGTTVLDPVVVPWSWNSITGITGYTAFVQPQAVTLLNQAYDALKESVYNALVVQTRLQPYLNTIGLVIDDGGIRFDTTALTAKLDAAKLADPRNELSDLVDLNLLAQGTLRAIGFDGVGRLRAEIAALPSDSPLLADLANWRIQTSGTAGTQLGDIYLGDAANNYFDAGAGNDVVDAGDGNDDIYGRDGDDVIDGGAGDDNIRGESGDDTLIGGIGNDSLSGGAGNDTFDGGAGNDTIYGDSGNDTFLFGKGDGQDTVFDTDTTVGNTDQIIFKAGVAVSDVQASRSGDTLVLTIKSTGDQIQVSNYFRDNATNGSQVEEIRFTDSPSTVWTVADAKNLILTGTAGNDGLRGFATADVMNGLDGNDDIYGGGGDDVIDGGAGDDNIRGEDGNDTLVGGVGNDSLSGGSGNDTFDGGAGDDTIYGDSGNDTFLFGKGDGQDTVFDTDTTVGNTDQIIFKAGVSVSDVQASRSGDTLVLTIKSTGDQIQVSNYFRDEATNGSQVEEIRFTDSPNTVWSVADMMSKILTGTAGNDGLRGFATADVINGLDGNDDIYGGGGDDVIDGGAGDDNIRGEDGSDILIGGAGNDSLSGGAGNDTFDGGAGNDTIYGDSGSDTYLFGKGDGQDTIFDTDTTVGNTDQIIFKAGVSVSDVQASRSGDTLVLKIKSTGDQIQVSNYFRDNATNGSQVEEIRFTDSPSTVWSIANVMELINAPVDDSANDSLDDTLIGTAAADSLYGYGGNDDIFGRDGDDMLDGGEGNDNIRGENGNDTLIGGAGDDALSGGSGNDTFNGGAGNDTMYGDSGNDTFLFGRGDGQDAVIDYDTTVGNTDQIIFKAGVAVSDVQASRSGDTLVLKINGTSDQIQVSGYFSGDAANGSQIEEIRFTDAPNTVWTVDDVKAKVLTGGSGNDYLLGYASADVINGGDGNDDIFGRDGDDVIDGGLGDDNIRGENGNDTMIGGAGNDALSGGSGNDTFNGGAGNDTMYGDGGNDTFLFGTGDGQDTVFDYDTTAGNTDQIVFKAGVTASDVQAVRSGDTLVLKINGTSDQIQVSGYFSGDGTNGSQIEEIRFTDSPNTVWSVTDVKSQVLTGTAANDYLTGFSGADVINGLDGNDDIFGRDGDDVIDGGLGDDNIRGENGNDTMMGGAGNDALSGGAGDDTFNGGAGNDIMYGDGGNDTYVVGRGDGVDTIVDTDSTEGNTDVVVLGADIAVDQLWFSQSGNNLDVSILGTTDKFSIQNWYGGSQYHVEQFKTSDGQTLLDSQVQNLVSAMASFGVPPSSQTAYTADENSALQPVIAANWH